MREILINHEIYWNDKLDDTTLVYLKLGFWILCKANQSPALLKIGKITHNIELFPLKTLDHISYDRYIRYKGFYLPSYTIKYDDVDDLWKIIKNSSILS